ncbi:eukaryotic peptide chain release factor GTP-binding subunit ERF3A-like [Brachionichthys hirsutus]|uniref:eukaryotic peptide chain release factor GTP-binding subunit ERF3A-like n=1 Tax=Brachionichthys hirsutus TaxID=412623 RepID=UPI003604A828
MDRGDTAPDSWEQEDDVEATADGQLESAFTNLNVNAKPFVPNVNAAEFVPCFTTKAPPENPDPAVAAESPSSMEASERAEPAAPVENGDAELGAEEPWDQKEVEPNGDEPGGGHRSPATEETTEEEEEATVPKVPPPQPDAPKKEHINVVFIGHVDAGKSTIGGQIMYLTGMVDKRTLEKYEREAKEKNRETWYLSWALDTNQEERDKGKTVEVGRAYFETDKKHFTILDAPGHKSFVPNMIGGASQADLAVLVISARKGEFETGFEKGGQTREHAMLAKTAGVKHLIVLVNKMDDPTVSWSLERYDECREKLVPFLKKVGFNPKKDVHFMPCSGLTGANLKEPTGMCSWYSGLPFIPECYVHNLLRVTAYVPSIRRDVLELIIGKMLKLDVSASRSDIEEAEEQREEELFHMDEDVAEPSSRTPVMTHPLAERLDALMAVLMSYVKDICHLNGSLHLERTKDFYRDVLCVFDKLILPTHACCHVQFILFYLCSFRLALAEAFLDHQWKILQNPSQPAVLRQAAVGYLGSFLARAKFIPASTVRACLDLLVPWIHRYIDGQDGGRRAWCDVGLHGPFYSACQAVFYTLVFRHRAMLEGNMKKGLEYLQGLNLERVVVCQLNPLKVCLPSVASMFAAITRKYQVAFCYTIIERNSRHRLPLVRGSAGGDCVAAGTNPLDSFFPFDPYLLKRSGRLIEPVYQVWEELADSELFPTAADQQASPDEDDDFLCGEETLKTDGVVAMTPSSYDSSLHGVGSSPSPSRDPGYDAPNQEASSHTQTRTFLQNSWGGGTQTD